VELDGHARIVMDFEGQQNNVTQPNSTAPTPELRQPQLFSEPRRQRSQGGRRLKTARRSTRKTHKQRKPTRGKVPAKRRQEKARRRPVGGERTVNRPQRSAGVQTGQSLSAEVTPLKATEAPGPAQGQLNLDFAPASGPAQPGSSERIAEPDLAQSKEKASPHLPVTRAGGIQWQLEKGAELASESLWQPASGTESRTPGGIVLPAKRTVLVVDDDPVMRMLLKLGLRAPEFECLAAENGKVAQELVAVKQPDLVLLDLLMPVMDGLSFLQWLRQTAKYQIPVLVFSNVDDPKITREALSSGANGVLCKPLHLNQLRASIQELVPR